MELSPTEAEGQLPWFRVQRGSWFHRDRSSGELGSARSAGLVILILKARDRRPGFLVLFFRPPPPPPRWGGMVLATSRKKQVKGPPLGAYPAPTPLGFRVPCVVLGAEPVFLLVHSRRSGAYIFLVLVISGDPSTGPSRRIVSWLLMAHSNPPLCGFCEMRLLGFFFKAEIGSIFAIFYCMSQLLEQEKIGP